MTHMYTTTASPEIDYSSVYVDTKGVFRWAIRETPKADLNETIESDAELAEILRDDPMQLMIDLRDVMKLDVDCEKYFTNNFKTFFTSGVILVKSAVSIMLAELMVSNSRSGIPFKVVKTVEEGHQYFLGGDFKALA